MASRIDRWLRERGLNPFGDPPGTDYAGGTPLYDERTGRTEDREEHVRRKHPDAPGPEAPPAPAPDPER